MSVANTIGSSIGKGAAYAVHASIKVGQGTGRFGQDVMSSTAQGYATKSEELATARAAVTASRQTKVAIKVVRKQTAKA